MIAVRRSSQLRLGLTVSFIAVVLWTIVGCGDQESPSVAPGNATPETTSFALGSNVQNATGTIRAVDGLEPYRDPEDNFELKFRVIPDVSLHVIVPDADKSITLVPLALSDEGNQQQQETTVVSEGTTTDFSQVKLLSVSDMPEVFRQDGVKVIFSGRVDIGPSRYLGSDRISFQLSKIQLTD